MKTKLSLLFSLAFSLFIANNVKAQATGSEYNTAIGFKFSPAAVTVKHFVKPNAALEGLGYFWRDGFRLTGLYEWHGNINGARGLKWYVGGGAHVDVWDENYRRGRDGKAAAGMDGVLGLDYKFNGAPINISVDWQPSITFIGASYSNAGWVGAAIRFAF
ncbi:MAG TPA: hypothetical protein PKD90_02975 [Phnomibacter sp.]|mgnify:CR=1 FL=1|nr:hypothetical protein [Phnomibacter sp.]